MTRRCTHTRLACQMWQCAAVPTGQDSSSSTWQMQKQRDNYNGRTAQNKTARHREHKRCPHTEASASTTIQRIEHPMQPFTATENVEQHNGNYSTLGDRDTPCTPQVSLTPRRPPPVTRPSIRCYPCSPAVAAESTNFVKYPPHIHTVSLVRRGNAQPTRDTSNTVPPPRPQTHGAKVNKRDCSATPQGSTDLLATRSHFRPPTFLVTRDMPAHSSAQHLYMNNGLTQPRCRRENNCQTTPSYERQAPRRASEQCNGKHEQDVADVTANNRVTQNT